MFKIFGLLLPIAALGLLATATAVADPKASALIEKAEKQLRGKSTQAILTMIIRRPSFERVLKLRTWTSSHDNALVEILSPKKEEGVSSLRKALQMWNFLPKTDQIVRIPSSLMLQSWMGSDFNNDDLMKASSLIRDYRHRFVRPKGLKAKEQVIVVECRPKPGAAVVWGKILYWARPSDGLPLKQQYFDDGGKLVRTVSFSQFKKMDDRIIPTAIRVDKAGEPGEFTTVTYNKILFDRQLDLSLFERDRLKMVAQKGKIVTAGWIQTPMRSVD